MKAPVAFFACEIGHLQAEIVYQEVFLPFCENYGFKPFRADVSSKPGKIPDQIFAAIESAAIFFAEVTPTNRNVFIEIGYAYATLTAERIVLIQQGKVDLPFDIADQNTIKYGVSPANYKKSMVEIGEALFRLMKGGQFRFFLAPNDPNEILTHCPKDGLSNVDLIPWGSADTGGQTRTRWGSIVVDHGHAKGNWTEAMKRRDGRQCSLMRVVPFETSKALARDDLLVATIRYFAEGEKVPVFSIAIDGVPAADGRKYSIPWHDRVGVLDEVSVIKIDCALNEILVRKPTGGRPRLDSDGEYNIAESGLSIYLGTEADRTKVTIHEILVERIPGGAVKAKG